MKPITDKLSDRSDWDLVNQVLTSTGQPEPMLVELAQRLAKRLRRDDARERAAVILRHDIYKHRAANTLAEIEGALEND